jgi:hypothetical protein
MRHHLDSATNNGKRGMKLDLFYEFDAARDDGDGHGAGMTRLAS